MRNEDTRPGVVREGAWPESASRPVAPPLSPSAVYATRDADMLDAQYDGQVKGFSYAREGHPNAAMLAAALDRLEGAAGGLVTGSGMAAVGLVLMGVLQAGDRLVAGDRLYGRTLRLMTEELPRLGVEVVFADAADGPAFARAITEETALVHVETVSNPTLRIADLPAIAEACWRRGVPLSVDNTFATPRLTRPLALGADYVIESVTKMLAGHSDVTLGYVGVRLADRLQRLTDAAVSWGLTPSPFDCWLALRGLQTLDVRLDRAERNAAALAGLLADSPAVAEVLWPGRPDHPDHARLSAVTGGRGGVLVSFRLHGGRAEVNRFVEASGLLFAPSLGDVATLVSHPASSSHRALTEEARAAQGISDGFLRLSVGIEDEATLVDRVSRGLAAAAG